VTIQGREKIKPGKVYILISNHQSMLDILVLYRLFVHFKWVSKIELFKVPIIGWNMSANRYISLKRGKQSGILHMMNDSEKAIRNGSSVMIFAEGTRSLDQQIKAFKEGAFKLAVKTQTPIIPIVIDGTGEALPRKGFVFKGQHNITLNVLDEISVEGLEDKDVKFLISKVRGLMEEELRSIRGNI
jgi:1-acyl-sn-glycerol-3-phosphate acyltransferase